MTLTGCREVPVSRRMYLSVLSLGAMLLAGCGSSAAATAPTVVAPPPSTPGPTAPSGNPGTSTPFPATAAPVTPTVTATRAARKTATPLSATATLAVPTATAAAAVGPPKLDFVSVRPLSVAAGGRISVSVRTSGATQRAELYLGSGAPNAPSPSTIPLTQSSPGTWSGTGSAPSVGGTYHFTVGLYSAADRRFLEDNDAWNVQVIGGSGASSTPGTANGVKPLFADIPLAPPFSYGNPVAAVFNANGQTVNGSEVVSNTRTDVAASTVAQFYSVHFPRSGWSTAGATVPAGATSFSLVATSGSRVCIVQFSSGTVHIFYG